MSKPLSFRFLTGLLLTVALSSCSSTTSSNLPAASSMASRAHTNSSAEAKVTLRNKSTAHWIYAYVDYSYNYNPIWINEAKTCIKPGGDWKTSITYNYPGRGPQIRIRTDAYGSDCSGLFPKLQREISFKDFTFNNGVADFDARYEYYQRDGYILCVAQGGSPGETCAWR